MSSNEKNDGSTADERVETQDPLPDRASTPTPEVDPAVRECLATNNYRVVSFLCRGSTCNVFKLVDTRDDQRIVAGKVINHSKVSTMVTQECSFFH